MSAMTAASMLVPQTAPKPGVVGCAHRPGCLPRPGVSLRVHRRLSRAGRLLTVPASVAADAPPMTGDLKPKSKNAELAIDAIRFLAIDGVNKSKSGHPGMPMGCAPMSYVLWKETLNINPRDPKWPNRDRFVLSAGHGSMLQYALLHLSGFPVGIEDLKQFRQWGSITPGHPENFETAGVEVTTGPLGQGIANAVGLALAESHLAARFNKPDLTLVDHYTYCIVGDGCNMEGISNEAASLAGHWKLGKLIAFYDDNRISIDGHTDISFTEDVLARYAALGWHTIHVKDGNHDLGALRAAIAAAKAVTDKPTIIKVSTTIGYGSPNKADSHDVHGSPLGAAETEATRENLHWPYGAFEVPEEAYKEFGEVAKRGEAAQAVWEETRKKYAELHADAYAEYEAITYGHLPAGWADALPTFTSSDKGLATRLHSQTMLNALSPVLPGLIGGSADLAGSCMTLVKSSGDYQAASPAERNLRFGVREHGMGAIANGIALYAPGFFPYVATFFIFTDYMRNAIRMAALSHAGVLFVMTHDSVGLGEDGPTHQPIEQLASFRAMPNILMLRPGDGNETAGAYKVAVENASGINATGKVRPSVMAFSRQGMPNMDTTSTDGVAHGAYVVAGTPLGETPEVILVGTGSELVFAVEAGKKLESEGIKVRVVSMPCWELFDEQSDEYKAAVFPPETKARVSIEAGSTFGWIKYLGPEGYAIGIDHFGNSAPGPVLYEKYGFTADNVAAKAKEILAGLK